MTINPAELRRILVKKGIAISEQTIYEDIEYIQKSNWQWLDSFRKLTMIIEQQDRLQGLKTAHKNIEIRLASGADHAGKPFTSYGYAAVVKALVDISDEIRKCQAMLDVNGEWLAEEFKADPSFIKAAMDPQLLSPKTRDIMK